MNKNKNRLILLLTALIFISLLALSLFGYKDYSMLIEGLSIEVTELSSENTKLEIERELLQPIYISEIISNTIALNDMTDSQTGPNAIIDYLNEVQTEHDYAAVYFISTKTYSYYESGGSTKKLDPSSPEDKWAYAFINKDIPYELFMEKRPDISQEIMLYVNYAVKEDDDFIGIVGVGISLNKIQNILASHNDEIDGTVFLANEAGTVQIHSNPYQIESPGLESLYQNRDEIFIKQQEPNIFFAETDEGENIFASYYIEDIDLFLVVNERYELLDFMLLYQKIRIVVAFIIVFLLLAILIIRITSHFHKKNIKLINTDYLTEIFNRNAFDDSLKEAVSFVKEKDSEITLAIIDVDDFKRINDVYGHIEGDKILKNTASHFNTFIRDKDIVARWGGDEFAVIFRCDLDHTKKILNRIKESVDENNILSKYGVTFSVGVTQCTKEDEIKSLLKRADEALYCAKDQGKDRICDI